MIFEQVSFHLWVSSIFLFCKLGYKYYYFQFASNNPKIYIELCRRIEDHKLLFTVYLKTQLSYHDIITSVLDQCYVIFVMRVRYYLNFSPPPRVISEIFRKRRKRNDFIFFEIKFNHYTI